MNIPDIENKLKQLKDEISTIAIDEFLHREFDIIDIQNKHNNRIYILKDTDIIIIVQTFYFSDDIKFIVTRTKY